ncbi:MAG: GldG family protein [bacterium]
MKTRKIKYSGNLLLATLIMIGILVMVNFLSVRHFRRIDLTEGQIYSISRSTKRNLADLTDIVNVKVYFSKELPPQLATLDRQVKDILDEYKAYSKEKLRIEFIDPAQDPELEQRMRFMGIPKVQLNVFQKDQAQLTNVYLGMMVMYEDRKEVIPVIQDTRNLEYDLTSAIIKVTQKEPKTVAFLISEDEEEFHEKTTSVREDLSRQYTVTTLDMKKEESIPSSVNTLIVMGPENTSERMQYEIDQFIMRGGKTIFLVDTVKLDARNMLQAQPVKHNLDEMLNNYGVKVNNDLTMDRYSATVGFNRGFFSFRIPYPYWPKAVNENMAKDSPIVNRLSSVTFPWTSSLELLPGRLKMMEAEGTVLAQTSSHGWLSQGSHNLDPGQKFHSPPSEMKHIPLAVLISGQLKSFFEGKPIPEPGKNPGDSQDQSIPEEGEEKEFIAESPSNQILVVGNSRMITNSYYQPEENGSFFLNSVDWLTMGEDLIGIRSREKTDYPLKPTEPPQRATIRYLNIFGVSVVLILFGLIKAYINRKTRIAWLDN